MRSFALRRMPLALLLIVLVGLPFVALPTAPVIEAQSFFPTLTPRADERSDACEPNNDRAQACVLPLNAVSGPFTFVPEGDRDVYSVSLPAAPDGLETTLTVRGTPGLDLLTTITLPDTNAVVGAIASPAISTTLPVTLTGWVVIDVENRAPGLSSGQSYRIDIRRTLPAPPEPEASLPHGGTGPAGAPRPIPTPDVLENNYSPETAAPIGVGVLYDLSFVCPEPGGCPGGDHDYLRLDVKAGTRYLLTTFDLAPGVDTVLDLFWWIPGQGWQISAANDDARPGSAFLSTLRWVAPADGTALVRIGPRTGGLDPILVGDQPIPTYRVAVALADSPLAEQLEARIATQTNAPTPTPVVNVPESGDPNGDPGSNGDPETGAPLPEPTPLPLELGTGGDAFVTRDSVAYAAPDATSPIVGDLPLDAIVTLTGRTQGLWAELVSSFIVGPAWVDRRDVRPLVAAPSPDPSIPVAPDVPLDPAQHGQSGPPVLGDGTGVPSPRGIIPAPPRPRADVTTPPPVVPVPVQATLSIRRDGHGVPGVRAILITGFDAVISEQTTDQDGNARFLASVAPSDALFLLLPGAGIRLPVTNGSQVVMDLPTEDRS